MNREWWKTAFEKTIVFKLRLERIEFKLMKKKKIEKQQ